MNPATHRTVPISGDTKTISAAEAILSGTKKKGKLSNLFPFLGPAFVASAAYVDPGNFATNIQGGSKFGYMLLKSKVP